jgi:hypothetical protein
MIPAVIERYAGIDVGKKFVMVCVMTGAANGDAQAEIARSAPPAGNWKRCGNGSSRRAARTSSWRARGCIGSPS